MSTLSSDPPRRFSITAWERAQRETYGFRDGAQDRMSSLREAFDPRMLGISGLFIDDLSTRRPWMLPDRVWGGALGWPSRIRFSTWSRLLGFGKSELLNASLGVLLRCQIDASEWIPHPYAPPTWALLDFKRFSTYITKSRRAFNLARKWSNENSEEIARRIRERFMDFNIQVGAQYYCVEREDFANIALLLPEGAEEFLSVKSIWKNQERLGGLVRQYFSDAQFEYSAPWLAGQRLDVYVPSVKVAFEYQGQQHYEAVELFGGEEGLAMTIERDRRKARACKREGIKLIKWSHIEPISAAILRVKLHKIGIYIELGPVGDAD